MMYIKCYVFVRLNNQLHSNAVMSILLVRHYLRFRAGLVGFCRHKSSLCSRKLCESSNLICQFFCHNVTILEPNSPISRDCFIFNFPLFQKNIRERGLKIDEIAKTVKWCKNKIKLCKSMTGIVYYLFLCCHE